MAIVAPMFVTAEVGQALSLVVTIPTDTTSWTAAFDLYDYEGQLTPVVSKTTAAGITNTPGASSSTMTIALTAANLTLSPGLRVWTLRRTNAGAEYPIVDRSGIMNTVSAGSAFPRLTNLAAYCAALGLSESTISDTDAKKYLWHLAAAESAVKRACRRQFTYAARTEYPVANWQRALILRETPVEAITSLYFDRSATAGQGATDFAADTLQTVATDYYLDRDRGSDNFSDSGLVYRTGGVWQGVHRRPVDHLSHTLNPARGTAKVLYIGGYGNAIRPPEDLLTAIFQVATIARLLAADGRLEQSFSGEGQSVSFGPLDAEATRLGSVQWAVGNYGRVIFA